MSDAAVQCNGLTKRYGDTAAVDAFDLDLKQGLLLALLGPSGCGKTTALRVIAGFERPDAGSVEIGGRLVAGPGKNVPPEKRRVGMVFQDYALFPHLTVGKNVAFGIPRGPDRKTSAATVLAMVGLAGLETRMPHELSGGQQQRVALARALAPNPDVILLDEPFSNLDAALRAQVRAEVKEILRAAGTTAIFVTHDQEEALFMGDLVAVMNAGRVEQVDEPQVLFHTPRSRFAAEFLGQADFLPATISDAGLTTEIGTVPSTNGHAVGQRGDVMMRPDDVTLARAETGPGRIAQVFFRGIHTMYQVALPSGQMVHALQHHHAVVLEPGEAVEVRLEPGHPLVFFPQDVSSSHGGGDPRDSA